MKNLFLTLTLSFALMINACSHKTTVSSSNVPLVGTTWLLSHAGGKEIGEIKYSTKKASMVLGEDSRLKGFLGCNSLAGGYKLSEKNGISFSPLATRMFCAETMWIEDDFSKALFTAKRYQIKGNTLSLFDEKGKIVADFVNIK